MVSFILPVAIRRRFSLLQTIEGITCQTVCDALPYLLDNIYIGFGTNHHTNTLLFCYDRGFMSSLSDYNQADIIEAYKYTSRYLGDLLNIDNPYFERIGTSNKCLTPKLLKQGYRYHKFRKAFSKFYRRHYEMGSKFNVGFKSLYDEGLAEPDLNGDLLNKFKKIIGRTDFSDQFRKVIIPYERIGYNINVMRQSACIVIFRFCF